MLVKFTSTEIFFFALPSISLDFFGVEWNDPFDAQEVGLDALRQSDISAASFTTPDVEPQQTRVTSASAGPSNFGAGISLSSSPSCACAFA